MLSNVCVCTGVHPSSFSAVEERCWHEETLVKMLCSVYFVFMVPTDILRLPWLRPFPCFFLRCKATSRVKLTKTWHGLHSPQLVICVLFYALFVSFVLFYILFVCKCVLYYCQSVSTQLQLTNISYHISIISYRITSYRISYRIVSHHIIYHIIYRIISYHVICHIISYHIKLPSPFSIVSNIGSNTKSRSLPASWLLLLNWMA